MFSFDFGDSDEEMGQPSSTAAAEDESKHAPTAGATAGSASSQPQAPAQPVPATVFMPSESLVATLLSQRIATAPVPAAGVDMVMVTAPPKVSGRLAEVLAETDVLSGVYEGGFKVWECALDVLSYLACSGMVPVTATTDAAATVSPSGTASAGGSSLGAGAPSAPASPPFRLGVGTTVLELGCGHGLPGVYCLQQGCRVVFQDRNIEVLRDVALPNALSNVGAVQCRDRARFVAGDWDLVQGTLEGPLFPRAVSSSGIREAAKQGGHYDIIVTTETVYSPAYYNVLLTLLVTQLRVGGVAIIGAKRYYFGTGGGTESFAVRVSRTPGLECRVAQVLEDGASNIRQVLLVRRLPRGNKRRAPDSASVGAGVTAATAAASPAGHASAPALGAGAAIVTAHDTDEHMTS